MATKTLYLRCDANDEVGYGHLRRCMVLGGELVRNGIAPVLVLRETDGPALLQARNQGFEIIVIPPGVPYHEEEAWLSAPSAGLLLDMLHHRFDAAMDADRMAGPAVAAGRSVIFIDSVAEDALPRDMAVQPDLIVAPYLDAELDTPPRCRRWLAGAEYAILPPGYDRPKPRAWVSSDGLRLLVTMGGSDPGRLTEFVLEMLKRLDSRIDVRVVIGPLFSPERRDGIRRQYATFDLVEAPEDMLPHYQWADAVIGATGLTRYETAALGIPSLLYCPHRRYRSYLQGFSRRGLCQLSFVDPAGMNGSDHIGELAGFITDPWTACPFPGSRVVDGRGAARIATAILQLECYLNA